MFLSTMIRFFALVSLVVPMALVSSSQNTAKPTNYTVVDGALSGGVMSMGVGLMLAPRTGSNSDYFTSVAKCTFGGAAFGASLGYLSVYLHRNQKRIASDNRLQDKNFKAKRMDDAREAQLAKELAFLKDTNATRMELAVK